MAELTIRQRAINALYAKIGDMLDGSTPVWQRTYLGDIDDLSNVQLPAVSLDEGTEAVHSRYGGCTRYELPVFFHFRWTLDRSVENITKYKYYLGLLQQAVLSDHQLGGLTLNILEESNAPAIFGQKHSHPGGVLTVIMSYRTMIHNPYKLPGEN